MNSTHRLLTALIDKLGFDIETTVTPVPSEDGQRFVKAELYKLIKKPKAKREKKEVIYTKQFEALWLYYPNRSGSNPKNKAFKAYNSRVTELCANCGGVFDFNIFKDGVIRYAQYCKAVGKENTEYVLQAATFFGEQRYYQEKWDIPKDTAKKKLPYNNDDLAGFAKLNELPSPNIGELFPAYRKRLEGLME